MSEQPIEVEIVPVAELDALREDSHKLTALEALGVDNWDGYEEAMRSLEGDN